LIPRLKRLPATFILIAINFLVFLAMLVHSTYVDGSWTGNFSRALMLRWGANYGPLTLGGQYWRLISCMFVHTSTMHLGWNMLFLWRLGAPLDRVLGRAQTFTIFLFTGVGASLTSLGWHPTSVAAGSSGAIYGQAGVLIALLALGKLSLPRRTIMGILFWVLLLMPVGLLVGHPSESPGYIAHVGGLVTGLAIGALLTTAFRASLSESIVRQHRAWYVTSFLLLLGLVGEIHLHRDVLNQYREEESRIADSQKQVSQNPNDANSYANLGDAYFMHEEFDQAVIQYRRSLKLKPGDSLVEYQLAVTYWSMGRSKDAISYFRETVSRGSATSDQCNMFAWILMSTGNLNEAEQIARKAVALDGMSRNNHRTLAAILTLLHKDKEAERETKLADQIPDPRVQTSKPAN
jgi:membrane associated rhomboid family serine protease